MSTCQRKIWNANRVLPLRQCGKPAKYTVGFGGYVRMPVCGVHAAVERRKGGDVEPATFVPADTSGAKP